MLETLTSLSKIKVSLTVKVHVWHTYTSAVLHIMSASGDFPLPLVISFVVFYFSVFILSILGNTWVIVTCYKTLKRKNVSLMWFVLNLATADLLFTLLTIFNGIAFLWRWVGGEIVCKLHGFLVETTYTASITTLVVISHERLTAIADPLNARARNFSSKGYRKVLIVWGFCLAACSPLLALYRLNLNERGEIECNNIAWGDIGRQVFYSLHAIFFFALPLSYMIFSQSKIFLALRTRRIAPTQLLRRVETSNARHKKVAKTLLALTVAFVFCWSQFMVNRTLMYFYLARPDGIWRTAQLLICLNAVLDPIMYGVYGGNLKTILRGCCCKPFKRMHQGGSASVLSHNKTQLITYNTVQVEHPVMLREINSC